MKTALTGSNLANLSSRTFVLDADLIEVDGYFTLSRLPHHLRVQVATN